ncbi:MAG TPA: hypothetical protein VGL46_13370 [Pseudonocardiaceae bacterium]|jgi:hypothetical protein
MNEDDPEWLDLVRRDPWLDHDITDEDHPAPRVHPVWAATVLLGMALFVVLMFIGVG